jgi:phosphoribosylanthranilate isomerase
MTIRTKICGLGRPADVSAAASAGANYIGLNFFPKSKRYVDLAQARALALDVSLGIAKVGLVVDEDNATIDAITAEVPLDMLQLHGSETPERVAEIKARYGLPVMKVIGVAEARDLAALDDYAGVCDQIMLDAKPPKDAILPGGNGIAFDWRLIAGRQWSTPWMLAGGLTPDNVAEAIRLTGANQVDVASGVESAPGVKDAKLMHDFVQAATGDS